MSKTRILFLDFNIPYLVNDEPRPIGGATIELYALMNGLVNIGHKVGVLTWKGAKTYLRKPVNFDIVETYRLNQGLRKFRWFYKRFPSLYRAVKSYAPNFLVQECAGFDTGVMGYISKKQGIEFIYKAVNNIDADGGYKTRLNFRGQLFYKYGLKCSSIIICQNKYQKEKFYEQYKNKKLFILHFPYLLKNSHIKIKKLIERKYIAWVGNFHHQKNMPALLEIIRELPNLNFKIVGDRTKVLLDAQTENSIYGLKKCPNVEFMGYLKRQDLPIFLSNAIALLSTSHYEGFPQIFLDAFASGTPVVTTKTVDPDDIIARNNLGIIEEENVRLIGALKRLIQIKEYDSMAERCKTYLESHHNPEVVAAQFIKNISGQE